MALFFEQQMNKMTKDDLIANIERIGMYCAPSGFMVVKQKANHRSYWEKVGSANIYDDLISITSFLPENVSLYVRYYFVKNGLTAVPLCPSCSKPINIPSSFGKKGLPLYHAGKCMKQATEAKRQATNLARYGTIFALQAAKIKEKARSNRTSDTIAKGIETKRKVDPTYGTKRQARKSATKKLLDNNADVKYVRELIVPAHVRTLINNPDWLREQNTLLTMKEIAQTVGVNKTTIQNRFAKYGIEPKQHYRSILETSVANIITSAGFDVITNTRRILPNRMEVDVYVPDIKLAFEINGQYWHTERNGKDINYHNNKTLAAQSIGVRLIHINEHEWVTKPSIVISRVRNLIGASEKIHARKCIIVTLAAAEYREFFTNTHIQGNVNARVCYGLIHEGELVAAMSFGVPRYTSGFEYELLRYSSSLNTSVVGGASKLYSHFLREHTPQTIITYSDRRWNTGEVYNRLGFTFSHSSRPSYQYVKGSGPPLSRIACQKHKLAALLPTFDPALTEKENMERHQYSRLWDCGHDVWHHIRTL